MKNEGVPVQKDLDFGKGKPGSRSELRNDVEPSEQEALHLMGAFMAGMSEAERRISRAQDVWSLLREANGANGSVGANKSKFKASFGKYAGSLKKAILEAGFQAKFSAPLTPQQIRDGLIDIENRVPGYSQTFSRVSVRKNHALQFKFGDSRIRLPFEYSRDASLQFIRLGRPSHVGLLKDVNHPDNYIAFQLIGQDLWLGHSTEETMRKISTGDSSVEEVSNISDLSIKKFDALHVQPVKLIEIKSQHSFGFAGFSIYLSSDSKQKLFMERPDGKFYRNGIEKVVTITYPHNGEQVLVLRMRSREADSFSIDGLGWRRPGEETRPLVIANNASSGKRPTINLNRIVDMIRTGELARQLHVFGAELVVDSAQMSLEHILAPDYIAASAGGRRVKVSHYQVAPFEDSFRLSYAGTILGHPEDQPSRSELRRASEHEDRIAVLRKQEQGGLRLAQSDAVFSNKRTLIDFNDLAANFSDAQIEEIMFVAQKSGANSKVHIYNVDPTEKLGKFLLSLNVKGLEASSENLDQVAASQLQMFSGEVVQLSSLNASLSADRLKRILEEAGIHAASVYSLAYHDKQSGTLGVGLKDVEEGKLKNQIPDYMAIDARGRIYLSDPSVAGAWQALYQASLVFSRAA